VLLDDLTGLILIASQEALIETAYFTPKLPLISPESCHPFQGKGATDFTPKLPPPAGG
jgi:hypothetical protein